MEKQFAGKSGARKTSALGGAKAAADIVNFLDPSTEGPVMEQIRKADEALGAKIQDLIFVFDNLLDIDDRGMQEAAAQRAERAPAARHEGRGRDAEGEDLQEHVAARGRDAQGRPRGEGPGAALRSGGRAEGNPGARPASSPKPAPFARRQGRESMSDAAAIAADAVAAGSAWSIRCRVVEGPDRRPPRSTDARAKAARQARHSPGLRGGGSPPRRPRSSRSSRKLEHAASRGCDSILSTLSRPLEELDARSRSSSPCWRSRSASRSCAASSDRSRAGHRDHSRNRRRGCRRRRATCGCTCIPRMPRSCASSSRRRRTSAPGPSSKTRRSRAAVAAYAPIRRRSMRGSRPASTRSSAPLLGDERAPPHAVASERTTDRMSRHTCTTSCMHTLERQLARNCATRRAHAAAARRGRAHAHDRSDARSRRLPGRGRRPLRRDRQRRRARRGRGRRLLRRPAVSHADRRHARPEAERARHSAHRRASTARVGAAAARPRHRRRRHSRSTAWARCSARIACASPARRSIRSRASRSHEPLDVGVRAINALLTVGRGQRIGLFAGSGVGKSVLLGMMARYTSADVIVVGLIGERGREVKEFIEHILGAEGRKRSVVVGGAGRQSAADAPARRVARHRDRRVLPRSGARTCC